MPLSRNGHGISPIESATTSSFEANAWFAWQKARWKIALNEASQWLADQPFSSRPALFGSFLASSVIEDFDDAVAFAQHGLLSNPEDFSLHNNLAFSLALRGDVKDAGKALAQIRTNSLTARERVIIKATAGLVAFRSGNIERGRELYGSAIAQGSSLEQIIARIYYAFEELRIHAPRAETLRQEAINGASDLREPHYVVLVERLKRFEAGGTK
jgi:hypothetical protein